MKKFVPGLSFIKQSVTLQNIRKFAVSLPVIFLKERFKINVSIKLDCCYCSKCEYQLNMYNFSTKTSRLPKCYHFGITFQYVRDIDTFCGIDRKTMS